MALPNGVHALLGTTQARHTLADIAEIAD
jgi:hypothetical protein